MTGGVGGKSIEDLVHKSSGGGREIKKIKMAGGIKSSMESEELSGGLGQGRAVSSITKSCFSMPSLHGSWMGEGLGYRPRAKQGLSGHPL